MFILVRAPLTDQPAAHSISSFSYQTALEENSKNMHLILHLPARALSPTDGGLAVHRVGDRGLLQLSDAPLPR